VRLDRSASLVGFLAGYGVALSADPSPEAQNERSAVAAKTPKAIRDCRSGEDIGFMCGGMRGYDSGHSVGGFPGKSKSEWGEI
jgi:hypothetical protein